MSHQILQVRCAMHAGCVSKMIENHEPNLALRYSFCRIHQSLRITPTMAAAVLTSSGALIK